MNPIPKNSKSKFTRLLIKWNEKSNKRQMPWKGEKDPYKIWVSEIILQQTRVDQGLDYYKRFVKEFPTIKKLAKAPDEKVFKLWEGLGYYSRCRNLLHTARFISNERDGKFPGSYEEIKELKGIGPYTAAAISSFAFDLPYAVLDGNVFRVLSRVFGILIPTDSNEGKKLFSQLSQELIDIKRPGLYNQAIMDFGAIICKPAIPKCNECCFQKMCFAYLNDSINELPRKEKKIKIRKRWFYYFVFEYESEVLVSERTGKDIWQNLFEFPLIESDSELTIEKLLQKAVSINWVDKSNENSSFSPLFKQQLSHQLIQGRFITVKLRKKIKPVQNAKWIKYKNLKQLAFPRFIYNQLAIIFDEIKEN